MARSFPTLRRASGLICVCFSISFTVVQTGASTVEDAYGARNAAMTAHNLARLKRLMEQVAHPPHPCHELPSAQDIALDAALTAEKANVDHAQLDMAANLRHDPASDAAYFAAEARALDAMEASSAIEDAMDAQTDAHGFTCSR